MDEKRLVAVRAALAWCLACKHYTLEQGASLAHIPESPVKHRDLRGHSDAHRCCRKPLMESALVRVGVRYTATGINFQACSFDHSDISGSH